MRNNISFSTDLKKKKNSATHNKGIKADSCLNELKYFDAIEGLPPDAMHDILEGCVRFNFKCLINLIGSKQYSIIQLNDDLNNFKYGRLDGENKVSLFS